jgi:hypothetical protein
LSTGTAAATCASEEKVSVGQGLQQLPTSGHLNGFSTVNLYIDIPTGHELAACDQNDHH